MRRTLKLLCAVLLLALLAACSTQPPLSSVVLEELCSKEYTGRLAGTPGNQKAAEYLAGMLATMGFKPFGDEFLQPYTQTLADPNSQNTSVVILFADGSERQLIHGKDFYTNAASKDLELEQPLAFTPDSWKECTVPVLFPDEGTTPPLWADVRINAQETPSLTVAAPTRGITFQINIAEKLARQLQQQGATGVRIKTTAVPVEHVLYNAVAKMPGKPGNNRVIVLSAHMDHAGQQGDFLFNGVVDNASGAATLLSAAQKLLESTRAQALGFDIVVAAVNSEETSANFPGSKALAQAIAQQYKVVVNLNIDCVGNGQPLCMGPGAAVSDTAMALFRDLLTQQAIPFSPISYGPDDHVSFEMLGYPAFTIGGAGAPGSAERMLLHANLYKTSDISVQEMETLAKAIASFVTDKGEQLLAPSTTARIAPGTPEYDEMIDAAIKEQLGGQRLAFDEYMYLSIQGRPTAVTSEVTITPDEARRCYPTLELPPQLGDYQLQAIEIGTEERLLTESYSSAITELPKDAVLGKPVKLQLTPEGIHYILLTYVNTTDATQVLEFVCNKIVPTIPAQIGDQQTTLALTSPGLEAYTLHSYNNGESYYSVSFEKDGFKNVAGWVIVRLGMRDSVLFTADEAPERIQTLGIATQ